MSADTQVAAEPVMSAVDDATLLRMHASMVRIRRFEERVGRLYSDGVVPGFVHLSIGQEAVAVGACDALRRTDGIVSTHRGHGHCLAKGADPEGMFAELMGRSTGTCRGLGGSMHIADLAVGVFGANGIVGAGLPIAGGVAAGFRQLGRDDVVVAFFGDGAVAQGAFHEALNLAALWHLPVLFLCENNRFAEFSAAETQHPVPVTDRALGYGVRAASVDGNDVGAVRGLMAEFVEELRAGRGPILLEALTTRVRGHYEGDAQPYRDADEREAWVAHDPLVRSAAALDDRGLRREREEAEAAVQHELEVAEERARNASPMEPDAFHRYVEAPRPDTPASGPPPEAPQVDDHDDGSPFRTMDAVHDALATAMEEDPTVWLAGIDVGAGGNVFGLTRGLHDRWPERVLDTPISETAVMGLAVGGAMAGTRPVVELMFLDFLGVCFDQLLNQAAKLRFMTGGQARMSLVVRTQFGSGRSSGSQHSQSLEALLAHVPGLTVVMPSTPEDTYGLLRAAIRDPNPVIFIEHRGLYGRKSSRPPADHLVPIGRGVVRRPGSTLTVVTWSAMVERSLEAAEHVAAEGIDVEVIDLRTIAPLDEDLVVTSVSKTTRLLVVHEATRSGGFGAEIAARVAERCIWRLDAPVRRCSPPSTPAPYATAMERAWLPGVEEIADAMRALARE